MVRMFQEAMDTGADLDAFPALRYLGHKQYKQLCESKRLREAQLYPYMEKAKVCKTLLGLKQFLPCIYNVGIVEPNIQ